MASTGLTEYELGLVRDILKRHKDITRAIIFGSRAKGTYHKNSDIDIAVEGISDNLSIEALASEFEDLPLPYRFDVKSVDNISNESLREHILRVGIPL